MTVAGDDSLLPPGARLAVDVGTVRIGVAVAPAGLSLAVPVETVPAGPSASARVAELAREHGAAVVYVGDPLQLDGTPGLAAHAARAFAGEIGAALAATAGGGGGGRPAAVRMVDERLTSAQSNKEMRAAGRNTRQSRSVLDQAAAVAILHNALAQERTTGHLAGADAEQDDR